MDNCLLCYLCRVSSIINYQLSIIMLRLFYQFPTWIQKLYKGVLWQKPDPSSKVIYLTFDDGCVPEVTPQVLTILEHYGVKATFFMVGDNIRKYPALFEQVHAAGHTIGNHTYHHVKGRKLTTEAYLKEIRICDEILLRNNIQPGLLRPPYGKMTLAQLKTLKDTHTIVLWDLLTHDYNPRFTPERIMRAIRNYSRNGSIVVFHDSLKAQKNMLTTLPQAIEFWQQEGYEFRTF